eukprot:PhF_6_TR18859/c0_g1_i2/m.27420
MSHSKSGTCYRSYNRFVTNDPTPSQSTSQSNSKTPPKSLSMTSSTLHSVSKTSTLSMMVHSNERFMTNDPTPSQSTSHSNSRTPEMSHSLSSSVTVVEKSLSLNIHSVSKTSTLSISFSNEHVATSDMTVSQSLSRSNYFKDPTLYGLYSLDPTPSLSTSI